MRTRTVETVVHVGTEPERVIRAFADEEDLAGWWKVSRSLVDPRRGGAWSVVWDDWGEAQTHHVWVGVIAEWEPLRMVVEPLVMVEPGRPVFGPLSLEVFAETEDDGCRLTVRHHGYRSGEHWDWLHGAVVEGWRHVLGDMQAWFERD